MIFFYLPLLLNPTISRNWNISYFSSCPLLINYNQIRSPSFYNMISLNTLLATFTVSSKFPMFLTILLKLSCVLLYSFQCLKRLFTWPAIPLEKQKSLLIKARDPNISYRFGGQCNLCTLSGFCLFCNSNRMKSPFLDVFDELLFIRSLVFTKICVIVSLSNKYPPCWSFKLAKSNQFKVDIKSRTGLT